MKSRVLQWAGCINLIIIVWPHSYVSLEHSILNKHCKMIPCNGKTFPANTTSQTYPSSAISSSILVFSASRSAISSSITNLSQPQLKLFVLFDWSCCRNRFYQYIKIEMEVISRSRPWWIQLINVDITFEMKFSKISGKATLVEICNFELSGGSTGYYLL
jgi:hypothetical protein